MANNNKLAAVCCNITQLPRENFRAMPSKCQRGATDLKSKYVYLLNIHSNYWMQNTEKCPTSQKFRPIFIWLPRVLLNSCNMSRDWSVQQITMWNDIIYMLVEKRGQRLHTNIHIYATRVTAQPTSVMPVMCTYYFLISP